MPTDEEKAELKDIAKRLADVTKAYARRTDADALSAVALTTYFVSEFNEAMKDQEPDDLL